MAAAPQEAPRLPDWPQVAARLATALPPERLHAQVVAALRELPAGARLGVALSGGADSLCALLAVWAHFPGVRARMVVLSYDHATRGTESAGDAAFAGEVATALGLDACSGKRAEGGRTDEASLRAARLAFFREHLRTGDFLVTGHHAGDVAEGMLLRLARGSGAAGLCGPRPVHRLGDGLTRLRPLLEVSRGRIEETLREAGAVWREDASNASELYLRNRLRRNVLPAWEAAEPERGVEAGLARARALLQEEDEALEAWLGELLPEIEKAEALDLRALAGKPVALWRRALTRWLGTRGVLACWSAAAFEDFCAAVRTEDTHRASAGAGRFVVYAEGILRMERAEETAPAWQAQGLAVPGELWLPDGSCLRARVEEVSSGLREKVFGGKVSPQGAVCLEADVLAAGPLSVRQRCPADRYRSLGTPGSRKLKHMFIDRKIPAPERTRRPVVCDGHGGILWAPGLPPAHDARLREESTRSCTLTFTPPPS